jgi:hypothetical protein
MALDIGITNVGNHRQSCSILVTMHSHTHLSKTRRRTAERLKCECAERNHLRVSLSTVLKHPCDYCGIYEGIAEPTCRCGRRFRGARYCDSCMMHHEQAVRCGSVYCTECDDDLCP